MAAAHRTEPSRAAWGVQRRFRAADGTWRSVSRGSIEAVLAALGADRPAPAEHHSAPLVVVTGRSQAGPGRGEIELENGESRPCAGDLPADLPLGYHRLHVGGGSRPLIVVPPTCHLPAGLRGFGFAVQLYATRSARSWGIGDFGDLAALGSWAEELGASHLIVNPLHAALPISPMETSPYFPSSRLFYNPLYCQVDAVAPGAITGLEEIAEAGTGLNRNRAIDRDAVIRLKLDALERVFLAGSGGVDAEAAMASRPLLADFALFCAVAERDGADWRRWPQALRHRDAGAIRRARADLNGRVCFHAWMQLVLEAQLAGAEERIGLITDLAVGVDPSGADAWVWQDVLAPGVTVGAPPDLFNTQGQDWGLPPFDPWKLRQAGYAPLIETLRANLRPRGGLRIDHVMGLSRLWWVPPGLSPGEGAYVSYPVDDLLGIVALESVRRGALVVGEDLGTVQGALRRKLSRRGLLSYRLLLFEDLPPRRWPRQALGAVTTHDLPTSAGLWDGSDLSAQHRLGLAPNELGTDQLIERFRRGGPGRDADVEVAILHAHRQLSESPCMLIVATLEDVAAVRERPNQPGTTAAQNPNWSMALPLSREELQRVPLATELAAILRRG